MKVPGSIVQFPAPRFGREVTAMSWNIRGKYGREGAEQKMTEIAAATRRVKPDIILLQELGNIQDAKTLNEKLGGEYPTIHYFPDRYHTVRKHGEERLVRGNMGLAFLARKDFRPIKEKSHRDVMDSGGQAVFARDFPEVRYEFPTETGPFRLRVFNGHLNSSCLDGELDAANDHKYKDVGSGMEAFNDIRKMMMRHQEADTAAGIVADRLKSNAEENILVMCDANAPPNTHTTQSFLQAGLKDAIHPKFTVSQVNGKRLDHAFVSPSLWLHMTELGRVKGGSFHKRSPWTQISDHLPVIVKFDTNHLLGPKVDSGEPGDKLDLSA